MENRIAYRVENHIAHVHLIRADKMNALDAEMMDALIEAGERVKADDSLRAVVLSGEGRAFCAGLDMGNFAAMAGGGDAGVSGNQKQRQPLAARSHGLANRPQKVAFTWREVQVPVIAAAQGFALGGGFQVFMGADMRYAAPGTKFSIMESRWGLVPDMGTTHVMARLAREDIVKELAMTARIFEAEEAYEYGFLTRICDDPIAAAFETATAIAARNPDAIRATKQLFNEPADRLVADTLLLESVLQDEIIGSPNQVEAVKAELEGREAVFSNGAAQKAAE
ncbi:MAG: crotonase/enoyl-CoA hydratase family protein [Rhodobiaceae bacterium]|jgi:enoyl-CoA hydratase/carnithine racemase|nr:crotonase/enoyl-CoA hydratase family protein [Rhodobiaceae bacterium]MBT5517566.1 crotonase/enoyl-CoA hydratase family protein [Rhodobiaceae bacterium]MBT7279343.1 crotonase/enoyl-CoA hydratase family protein [Rhodobiaceae bacterium]